MKKVLLLLVSIILMILALGVSSYADTLCNTAVDPRWASTAALDYYLDFDNSDIGYAEISVSGNIGVNKIIGEIEVYRQTGSTWTYVSGDTMTSNTRTLLMSVPVTGTSGGYYKAVFTITVYKDDIPEVITRTCYATCP